MEITNEFEPNSDVVETNVINELTMSPSDIYRVRLRLRPKRAHGHLHVQGIKYKLCLGENVKLVDRPTLDKELICGKQLFELRGPRLNNTHQAMKSVIYDVDNRLNLKVINKTPLMQV